MPHKLPEYAQIFDKRGRDYHEAMLRFPDAREEEFLNLLALADIRDRQVVCDYPSGGGYMERYLTQKVDLILLETSQVFLQCAAEHSKAQRLLVKDGKIPLQQGATDRFLSLAGLHHLSDKRPFFSEVYRCLKLGGVFTLADAYAGSGVAAFLNEFVHHHSEEGHEGIFLDESTKDELEEAGFNVMYSQSIAYPWKFTSISDMVEFCRLMFGITRAGPREIEAAIREYLGVREYDGQYHLGWELLFLVAEK